MEDNELERSAVVEPLIKGGCFPNRVEVETNSVARGHDCARDNIVAPHKGARYWFSDAIDIYRGCANEGNNETDGCCKQRRDHQDAKPTDIKTIVGACNPLTK